MVSRREALRALASGASATALSPLLAGCARSALRTRPKVLATSRPSVGLDSLRVAMQSIVDELDPYFDEVWMSAVRIEGHDLWVDARESRDDERNLQALCIGLVDGTQTMELVVNDVSFPMIGRLRSRALPLRGQRRAEKELPETIGDAPTSAIEQFVTDVRLDPRVRPHSWIHEELRSLFVRTQFKEDSRVLYRASHLRWRDQEELVVTKAYARRQRLVRSWAGVSYWTKFGDRLHTEVAEQSRLGGFEILDLLADDARRAHEGAISAAYSEHPQERLGEIAMSPGAHAFVWNHALRDFLVESSSAASHAIDDASAQMIGGYFFDRRAHLSRRRQLFLGPQRQPNDAEFQNLVVTKERMPGRALGDFSGVVVDLCTDASYCPQSGLLTILVDAGREFAGGRFTGRRFRQFSVRAKIEELFATPLSLPPSDRCFEDKRGNWRGIRTRGSAGLGLVSSGAYDFGVGG